MPQEADQRGDPQRDESSLQRLDRNTIELLNELRVAATGIQVLFAFLLVAPFDQRFATLSVFQRDEYFGTLVCIAIATALLIAPSVHHRLLFRHHEKPFLIGFGNQLMITAMVFVSLGMTGILFLIADLLFGAAGAAVTAALTALGFGWLWFAIPLARRRHQDEPRD